MRPPLDIGTYGEISLRQLPTGKWQARAYYRDHTGRRREKTARAKTKTLATAELKRRLNQHIETQEAINSYTTMSELLDHWFTTLDVRPSTYRNYQRHANMITKHIGQRRLMEVTPQTLDIFLKDMTTKRHDPVSQQVIGGPSTAVQIHKVLKAALDISVKYGVHPSNPARVVKTFAKNATPVRTLTAEQVKQIRVNAREYFQQHPTLSTGAWSPDVTDLLAGTGARIGEILGARWEDIDLDTQVWTITGTMTKAGFTETKTGQTRAVHLPSYVVAMLKRRRMACPPDYPYVFWTRKYTVPLPENYYSTAKNSYGEGFEWVTGHTFRKTIATLLADTVGADAAAVQLGHEGTAVTKKHYIERHGVSDATDVLELFG